MKKFAQLGGIKEQFKGNPEENIKNELNVKNEKIEQKIEQKVEKNDNKSNSEKKGNDMKSNPVSSEETYKSIQTLLRENTFDFPLE